MENTITTVIWDMGGVILRSEDRTPRQKLAEQYKIPLDDLYTLVFNSDSAKLATIGKMDETGHWKSVANVLGISEQELDHFQEQFWAGDSLDLKLIEFIRSLQGKYKTALLSNAWSGARNVLTNVRPCMDVFHHSFFSYEVGLAKPDPEIYKLILNQMDVKPGKAIFVDDVAENIEAANQVGIHGIQFLTSDQAQRDVSELLGLDRPK
jgi:epoxide hydrolase-like predicted phosphatase